MKFEIGNIYSGFKFESETVIDEINSKGRVFKHIKSGAVLVNLKNKDDNKVFSITFKTLPHDSTGVAHILEHSVLCGSRKFKVKEPFIEILKGSLNTYLNAATYADKTMYPVASRNKKDFMNLMDVYLDAVFYPDIYNTPEIIMQEGWHYDIKDEEDEIEYNGVVYNEMKGAYSSPISLLSRSMDEELFKGSVYGVDSGGKVENIVDLSYEEALSFHEKYYHPSNSIIYVYGDIDIEEVLEFINDNYLKDFNKKNIDADIKVNGAFSKVHEKELEYSISEGESENDKTYFGMSFVTGDALDTELSMGLELLEGILLEASSSPLRRAIVEENIGKDVFGVFDSSILKNTFSIILKDSNLEDKDKFKEVVKNTLKEIVKNGIDKKLINGIINAKEFALRESDFDSYPAGLVYNEKILESMLYGGDPFINLRFNDVIKNIRKYAESNYFENLIEKYILNNNYGVFITVKPKKNLEEEREEELREKLRKFKDGLSKDDLKKLIASNRSLELRQDTPDSEENLESIPLIAIGDVKRDIETIEHKIIDENNAKIIWCPLNTRGIQYVSIYFEGKSVPQNMIPYASLLSSVIGKVNTEKYNFKELSNEAMENLGGMDFGLDVYSRPQNYEDYAPKFAVRAKSLREKLPKMFEIMEEIINHSIYDDYKRLKEIIDEIKSRMEMAIRGSGSRMASVRVGSYVSSAYKYLDTITGIDFYKFIVDISSNFEEKKEEIAANLKAASDYIFKRDNLIAAYCAEEEDYETFSKLFNDFTLKLKNNNFKLNDYKFELKKLNEAFMMSTKVQYVAKGFNFRKFNFKHNGALIVLRTIANYDYLWNSIRVKGGAYGASMSLSRNGHLAFASYRDPNLLETLKAYEEMVSFVKDFNVNSREMDKYILGTISGIDMPLSNYSKCEKVTAQYLTGIDDEYMRKERLEILDCSVEDIKDSYDILKKLNEENCICVFGSEEKIKENKELFDNVVDIFGE
ncbi:peptidase M16 [Clostridium acetobutylicum]|nr:peptidase M16 [Clostridium acetobutylicum]